MGDDGARMSIREQIDRLLDMIEREKDSSKKLAVILSLANKVYAGAKF